MGVIVIGRFSTDPAKLAKLWDDRKAEFEGIRERAKAAGATHHRWGFGDGEVLIVDEWRDAAAFQKFFESETVIPELMQAADVQGAPVFSVYEAKDAPDQF